MGVAVGVSVAFAAGVTVRFVVGVAVATGLCVTTFGVGVSVALDEEVAVDVA